MRERIEQAISVLVMTLKAFSPYDKGRLSTVGIRIVYGSTTYIAIGGSEAYYAVYTNEEWISPKWHGKKNPNEDWIDHAIKAALPIVRDIFSGNVTENEVQDYVNEQQLKYVSMQKSKGVDYYDI